MDKHDKHNKPGKSRKPSPAAAPVKVEEPAVAPAEKAKGDWNGKPSGKKNR